MVAVLTEGAAVEAAAVSPDLAVAVDL